MPWLTQGVLGQVVPLHHVGDPGFQLGFEGGVSSSNPPTIDRMHNLQLLLLNCSKDMRDGSPTYPERFKTNCLDHLPAAS